ncbi:MULTISPECIES: DUF7507 domain-containing protein [Exiguobacterium]|uniref:DUF7507 domain-containing protein n=1 Tax=Exiguobacterium TaxID=33986 RepID=UPI001BECC583|nr:MULTISPECIES: LPXTG cell wall anchor domain-containing protein [Exiguobacterium]MCT4783476.1 LPXTG cell wall anchor domain-containing protein [Exiguobacterium himgiriensis]
MTHATRRWTAWIALVALLIGLLTPNVLYAETSSTIYVQVDLTTEEADRLFESSLVYEDVTYYGVRETADTWRFMIDAARVDGSLIDTVTLYDEARVPYSFTAFTITEETVTAPATTLETEVPVVEDVQEEPLVEEPVAEETPLAEVPVAEPPAEEPVAEAPVAEVEVMTEEAAATSLTPSVAIDKLALGADGEITEVLAGDLLTYRLVIHVAGAPLENVSVTDAVPEALTVVADSIEVIGPEGVETPIPTVVSGPPAFNWTFPVIPVGTTVIQFDTFAPDLEMEMDVTNTFCIGVENEAIPNDCADVTVTVVPNEMIGLEVGKEANIDQAVVGGMIPYTFIIENTGETSLTVTSIEDEFFDGGMSAEAIRVFNETLQTRFDALIGEDGLAPGERVETTINLEVPDDYDAATEPEIGNIFRVAATDEYGRVIDAESQQIVLLDRIDFTVTKEANSKTVHPGDAIVYTYTITNTSNVTLHFVDVMEEWTSGALTVTEQRDATEALRNGMRALAEVENGLVPGEEVVLEMEQVLLPSYDVRAGETLTNRVTFTFEVSGNRVSRSAEATVHVKQAIPEREDDSAYVKDPTTPPTQGTLPMTGSTSTWVTALGLLFLLVGLMTFMYRRRPSNKA